MSNCLPIVLLAISLPALAGAGAQEPDRSRTSAQAARAAARLQELHQEAERLAGESRSLLGDLRKLEVDRQLRTEEFRKADADATAAAAELEALTAQIAALQEQSDADKPAVAARMVELYKLGEARYLRLFLSTADAQRLGEASRMVAALAKRDRDRIETYRRRLADLGARRARAEERSQALAMARDQSQRARAAADRAVRQRDGLIREIDRRRDLNAQLAGELQLAQQKLQLTLKAAGESGAAEPAILPIRPFRGALGWPAAGTLRRRFQARAGGAPSNGIEIAVAEGTPVTAVHGGTVAFAGPFAGYGKLVIVDHGAQTFSLYGYLLDIAVAPDARVGGGERLGAAGLTMSGTAGLYFELRVDGRPVDPLQWLEGR